MTFREKLRKEDPNHVDDKKYIGGCEGCPVDYCYEEEIDRPCNGFCCFPSTELCRKCWDREIPNEQEQNTTTQSETEMSTNESGGKQHKRPFRCQAIPPKAALEIGKVRYVGFNEYGYSDDNYKLIDANEHLGRALRHIFLALDGEDRRNNLSHAATRLLFALEQEIENEQKGE